ncbi:outer membrane-specific lipoprotein transporter subunit LolE [Symmachiella macrocystis]|uniref:Outer membrane-specific lipoprotein transporter subunit LolE n=1 Tax=Symmachiella macrocystis TaxID=2527985 RepID=A0A5C6BQT0_9PLAN|nr:FtsX-like permease family protein [Symmachiella macrocystis]TWU14600.1 outer membrane-specific lipoprotein transporter subunit LolE [Symmachiella macrocystis]
MIGTMRLIINEIRYRKFNFLLSLGAVAAATAIFVAFHTITTAQERETRRVTRDLGFNLRVIPRETDMDRFYATGYSDLTMDEQAVHRLVEYPGLSYNHLVATLQRHFELSGVPVLLTGISNEYAPPGQKKKPMIFTVPPGKVYVGFEVAQRLNIKNGETLDVGGKSFVVERTLSETGTSEDVRVSANLSDVQDILSEPGRINEIQAIDCLCMTPDEDPLGILRSELDSAFPDAKVIMLKSMAEARARQRQSAEKFFAYLTPIILIGCALCVGALAMMNVNDRRQEVGLYRALGRSSARIMALFIGKAIVIGLCGAAAGFFLGGALALNLGPIIFPVTAAAIKWPWPLLNASLAAATGFTVIASFLPAAAAAAQDPAVVLRDT